MLKIYEFYQSLMLPYEAKLKKGGLHRLTLRVLTIGPLIVLVFFLNRDFVSHSVNDLLFAIGFGYAALTAPFLWVLFQDLVSGEGDSSFGFSFGDDSGHLDNNDSSACEPAQDHTADFDTGGSCGDSD
ncbi:hypothetical protein [uncultured Roseibium sp.]|uniref:hypothetical protein n=1 Tax=uncultured Roseibium sp. TaxID=1936171 RepID=UPI0026272F60|nr:hypothetical protein [uncultured Roseibium sp.]